MTNYTRTTTRIITAAAIVAMAGSAVAQTLPDNPYATNPTMLKQQPMQPQPAPAMPPKEQVHQENTITYVSGGVGEESLAELKAAEKSYNLKITMTLRNGDFLADLPLQLLDKNGAVLLDTRTEGPLFYADLPKGSYSVAISYEGDTKRQNIVIGNNTTQKQIVYRWDAIEE